MSTASDHPSMAAPTASTGLVGLRVPLAWIALLALSCFQFSCSPAADDVDPDATLGAQPAAIKDPGKPPPAQLDEMLLSEELIEGFRDDMDALAFAVRNLELPDVRTRRLFRPLGLQVTDLAPQTDSPSADATLRSIGLRLQNWPSAEATEETNHSVNLWRPFFDQVDHFRWSNFKIKSGHFIDAPADQPQEFEAHVAFTGLASLRTGELSWIRNRQVLRWRLIQGTDRVKNENWRITAWKMESANRLDAPGPLFEDVLDQAIPDLAQRRTARFSKHERFVADRLLAKRAGETFTPPHAVFTDIANDRHPGLAVVDLDADGFDDLYVVTRWGKNQFLHNRGDGTFVERAAAIGLDVEGFSSSAVFADFDNDGDPDLFLGRTLERSAYYENQNGHFVERSSELVDRALPYLTSSISATDFDGDGLLDVFLSTYAASLMAVEQFEAFLSADEMIALRKRWQGHSSLLDLNGPPNVLLHNEGGGKFSIVAETGDLAAFRNTYQATWADFDDDGDPDVYLSNDFAADSMIRNDGEGRFVEATEQLGFSSFGLGMGASWGDYDRDGRQDVYVTNMYSTAGSRITNQLDYVDKRYREMAQGNYLYRNEDTGFRKVSGSTPKDLAVERTGWSWGSQFVDVDNDGFLDLSVLNGFYTAPPEVALSGDT